jgi:hypothetical protein
MTPHLFYFIPHSKINSSTHNNFTSNQKNERTRYNKSDLEREIEQTTIATTTELPLALQQPTHPNPNFSPPCRSAAKLPEMPPTQESGDDSAGFWKRCRSDYKRGILKMIAENGIGKTEKELWWTQNKIK